MRATRRSPRALENKDGTTDFDVTTGTLDSSATAPGNISKVQFKTYNGNGDVQWRKNYSSLTSGGTLHYNFPDLHRGQPIQTQANIGGIDKRTDVVTVTGDVKPRPDRAVTSRDAPSHAVVGSHVDISARVIGGDEARKRVDGGEPSVSRGCAVAKPLLEMKQEGDDRVGRQVLEVELDEGRLWRAARNRRRSVKASW